MSHRPLALSAVVLAFVLFPTLLTRAAERRPNILILLPDQMRAAALGCMGNADAKTPHLDRLAGQGLLLRNTFANSPVCCPARAIMLTGTYAHVNGMVANDLRLREAHVTLAEILGKAGYRTGFIGKWHLDGGPRNPGFVPPGERRQGFEFWAADECRHAHFKPIYFRDTAVPIQSTQFEPELWTDLAIEFLSTQPADKPFFLTVSMGPPHDPYGAPKRYMDQFDPTTLTMRPNWVEGVAGGSRKDIAAYYAACTAVDEQIGRLMAYLKDHGLDENTIVLFTSDHGDMLGSQGRRLKRVPWDESIRVPGIVRWPAKIKPATTTDAIFSHVDVAPTLLALSGLDVPPNMQGTNLAPLLLGQARAAPESAFFQQLVPYRSDRLDHPWRGVRTARHLYARTEQGPWLLYDLQADPYEKKNLIDDPAHAKLLAEMDAKLADWMKRTGDAWSFNSNEFVDDGGRLYRTPTAFYTIKEFLEWEAASGKTPAKP